MKEIFGDLISVGKFLAILYHWSLFYDGRASKTNTFLYKKLLIVGTKIYLSYSHKN